MRVNIYIRKEDEKNWARIPNKPDWLHKQIVSSMKPRMVFRPLPLTNLDTKHKRWESDRMVQQAKERTVQNPDVI